MNFQNIKKMVFHSVLGDLNRRCRHYDPTPQAISRSPQLLGLIKNGILYLFGFRLVSAYQDKVIDRRDKHYAYVTKKLDFQYGGVNFRNFVQMILDDSERQKE